MEMNQISGALPVVVPEVLVVIEDHHHESDQQQPPSSSDSALDTPLSSTPGLLAGMGRNSLSTSRSSTPLLSRSPRPSEGREILPTRSLSIRTPAPSPSLSSPFAFRLRSRRSLFLFGSLFVAFLFYRKSSEWSDASTASIDQEEAEQCRLFPWMAKCVGRDWGHQDPFEGLHFEKEAGHMFYPAHSASEEENAIPPNQPHPIHLLISDAKRDWDKKRARQSKSLREAVEEYERRYKMRPPKGFAKWFEFAMANNFLLPDEFDSMHLRILPYLALPPKVLRQRSEKMQHDTEFWLQDKTFTLQVRQGAMEAVGPMSQPGNNGRANQMIDLLGGISDQLEDMNITFTGHDVPWIGLSGEARVRMIEAASAGNYIEEKYFEDYQDNWDLDGWASICPPDSPLRKAKHFEERQSTWVQPRPSFIQDHLAAMDFCQFPDRQNLHGFTAWPGPRPGLVFPIFSFTGTSVHADFLAPPVDQYDNPVGNDPEWDDKDFDKILWRGSTTGADLNVPHMRKWSQRPRLLSLAKQTGTLTLPYAPNDTPGTLGPSELFSASALSLAYNYFDFKFLGQPAQCADPVACEEFRKNFQWDTWVSFDEQNRYKYQLDVDGNGWSGRFHRLLSGKSMTMKSTIFPEWYSDHIQPWLHYVPVSIDYVDLFPIMAFFRGGRDGFGSHDDLAKEIGAAGKEWAENHWRKVDMQVYFYRLLIEYDRIMNRADDDPRSMDM
ncbi:hypothetical protein P7C70_g3518, partial [Phenoliferia sp. Uapishka_3]